MRWNSTSDLLEISSSRSRRSAVTRRTRLRRSSACSPPACPAGSSSLSSLAAADAAGGSGPLPAGRESSPAAPRGPAAGAAHQAFEALHQAVDLFPPGAFGPACVAGGRVPIRSNRSQPWSNASICSDCRSRRPSCASTRQSSMTCATRTPASARRSAPRLSASARRASGFQLVGLGRLSCQAPRSSARPALRGARRRGWRGSIRAGIAWMPSTSSTGAPPDRRRRK